MAPGKIGLLLCKNSREAALMEREMNDSFDPVVMAKLNENQKAKTPKADIKYVSSWECMTQTLPELAGALKTPKAGNLSRSDVQESSYYQTKSRVGHGSCSTTSRSATPTIRSTQPRVKTDHLSRYQYRHSNDAHHLEQRLLRLQCTIPVASEDRYNSSNTQSKMLQISHSEDDEWIAGLDAYPSHPSIYAKRSTPKSSRRSRKDKTISHQKLESIIISALTPTKQYKEPRVPAVRTMQTASLSHSSAESCDSLDAISSWGSDEHLHVVSRVKTKQEPKKSKNNRCNKKEQLVRNEPLERSSSHLSYASGVVSSENYPLKYYTVMNGSSEKGFELFDERSYRRSDRTGTTRYKHYR
jgi:hypothetical protein